MPAKTPSRGVPLLSMVRSLPNVRTPATSESDVRKLYSLSMSQLRQQAESRDIHFKPSPFYMRWMYGYNHKVGVYNLNHNGSTIVFYAACNCGILYNWTTRSMRILQGHRHMVTCISADGQGRWIATGDTGSENVVIIWDSMDAFPQRTIFNPHRNLKLVKLALSADSKYLITLAYQKEFAELNWWIWSYGLNEPHARIDVPITKDSVLDMQFNQFNTQQFVLMTKHDIWIGVSGKIYVLERGLVKETEDYQLKIRCPERKQMGDWTGKLTCFCFVKTTSQIIVGTNRGAVLIYGFTMEHKYTTHPTHFEDLKFVKLLKVEKHRINVIKYVDEVIVTGNGGGQINFYDDQMKLLYWVHGFTVESVRGLSFNLSHRSCMILDPKCNKICQCWEQVVAEVDPDTKLVRNKLLKKKLPTDATKGGLSFLVRDFIVVCYNHGIGFVDFVMEKNNIILDYKVSAILALTVHPEKELACMGFMSGQVELLDYTNHKLRVRRDLRDFYKIVIPPDEDSVVGNTEVIIPQLSVTCLKYSPSGMHLACGLNTGQLLFLDPTSIEVKSRTPFKDTQHAVRAISYSCDSMTLAFSDAGNTVCVYKYNREAFRWMFVGKHRAHYKDINSVFFLPAKNPNGDYKLISFGMDRVMVEYDVGASEDECLEVLSLDRVEQTAVPLWGIVWPMPKDLDAEECHTHLPTVLVANDEHKFKIINYETTMTLATYLGPRFEHPVKQMMLVKKGDEKNVVNDYLLFATKCIIGIQKMPIDGNPWKHVGMLGHPNGLIKMSFRDDTGTLFTIGAKDNCMCQWHANFRAVEKTAKLGGGDLDPYYCLVENGRPGWLFQEIRDLFYYIQILCQGTFSPAMRRVKDYIAIDSLPDLMRALGFFPSEYEVENLLIEAKYKVYNRNPVPEVDFEEFVKLYLNHRPAFLESTKKIQSAFKTFAKTSKKDGDYLRRDDFVSVLGEYGECFSRELSWYLLSILSGQSFDDRAASSEEDFSFLPNKIKLSDIITTIMGIPDADTTSEQQSYGPSVSSFANEDSSTESEVFNLFG